MPQEPNRTNWGTFDFQRDVPYSLTVGAHEKRSTSSSTNAQLANIPSRLLGSGYIGGLILENLLRKCPDVEKVRTRCGDIEQETAH